MLARAYNGGADRPGVSSGKQQGPRNPGPPHCRNPGTPCQVAHKVHPMPRLRSLQGRVALLRPSGPEALTIAASIRTRGRAWQEIRAAILARDRGLCQVCAAAGRVQLAAEVDHVRPLAEGGTDAPENLQSLCTPCHLVKSSAEAARRAGRQGV